MAAPVTSTASGSVLEEHTIWLTVDTPIKFRTYYNSETVIYYELLPLVDRMNFDNTLTAMRTIPRGYTITAGHFNDERLLQSHHIAPDALFGDQAALMFLCSLVGPSDVLRSLLETCMRRIESSRVRQMAHQLEQIHAQNRTVLGAMNKLLNLQKGMCRVLIDILNTVQPAAAKSISP